MKTKQSFGKFLSDERKKQGFTQKDLAARIVKEGGKPISPQYLNDLEHDRRNPPTGYMLKQFAKVLGISEEIFLFHAGEIPPEMKGLKAEPEKIKAAYHAFRKELKK